MTLINAAGSNDKQQFIQALISALSDFYNKEPGTNIEKIYQTLSGILALTDRDVSATHNDNTLFAIVTDESVTRDINEEDHLGQEGVFEIGRIGFTPSLHIQTEMHQIKVIDTTITLQLIPVDYTSVHIYNAHDTDRVTVSGIVSYNEDNNTITVAGVSKPGWYVFEYIDKGNVKKETEALQIPAEVFQIGFDEGGFGNYGFGE